MKIEVTPEGVGENVFADTKFISIHFRKVINARKQMYQESKT